MDMVSGLAVRLRPATIHSKMPVIGQFQHRTPSAASDSFTMRFSGYDGQYGMAGEVSQILDSYDPMLKGAARIFDRILLQDVDIADGAYVHWKDAKEEFRKGIWGILQNRRLEHHIGATLIFTLRYYLAGNLPVKDIVPFMDTALTYLNGLGVDPFHDLITQNNIGKVLPDKTKFPLKALTALVNGSELEKFTESELADMDSSMMPGLYMTPGFKNLLKLNTPQDLSNEIYQFKAISLSELKSVLKMLPSKYDSLGLTYMKAVTGDEIAFVDLVTRILISDASMPIMETIAQRMETVMDSLAGAGYRASAPDNPKVRIGHHPNLAEFFLYLNAPALQGKSDINTFTSAISSIERFINYSIPVTGKTVNNWARIGLLTHGFRFWKFDAMGGNDSLLAQYGFQPIEGRDSDKTFGPGYLFKKDNKSQSGNKDKTISQQVSFDERNKQFTVKTAIIPKSGIHADTLIEFRRGYLLISHPYSGTLIIRNSSHVFGRNLMEEPAYYSPNVMTEAQIKTFAPMQKELDKLGFERIMSPELNQTSGFQEKLDVLLSEAAKLKKSYANWKFNPKAFDLEDTFTGDMTPGLRAVLNMIEQRLGERELGMSDKPVPVLGIYKPNLPPDFNFPYTDTNGESHAYFEFTSENVRELEARLNGTWSEEAFPNSQWTAFVQTAVDKSAEIVLVDPPSES